MVRHLSKCHYITNTDRGRTLATSWKRGIGRQAWSCGFCINLFSTLQDRLKHIDLEHLRRYQKIEEWDGTKVIQGLLLQPRVYEAFQGEMASRYRMEPPGMMWQISSVQDLQLRLEMRPSDEQNAISQANAAFDGCEIHGYHGWNATSAQAGVDHENMEIDSGIFREYDPSFSAPDVSTDVSALESMLGEEQHDTRFGEWQQNGQMPKVLGLSLSGETVIPERNVAFQLLVHPFTHTSSRFHI